jgi:hypothetical protein
MGLTLIPFSYKIVVRELFEQSNHTALMMLVALGCDTVTGSMALHLYEHEPNDASISKTRFPINTQNQSKLMNSLREPITTKNKDAEGKPSTLSRKRDYINGTLSFV